MGELEKLFDKRDWSTSAVGPTASWPASLRTVLRIMLSSRYAMWLGWGRELTFFYNDEYAEQTLGAKHPWALGRPAAEVWAEIWDAVGPRIDHVLATGEATWDEGLLLFLERNGFPEETYHTFSYSPAPNDDGSTGGLFCVVIEETERVIGERRLRFLRDLGERITTAKTVANALTALEHSLEKRSIDFPFTLAYLEDSETGEMRRSARTGIDDAHPWAGNDAAWPVDAVRASGEPVIVTLDPSVAWPVTPWGKPPAQAIVLPLTQQVPGVLVAALNPYRPVDEATRNFAELFAGQLSGGLATGRAYEEEKRRAEALAEIDRAKTAFFSNVSHEFRTPLTLMLGPTEDALATPERTLSGEQLELVHRNELRLLKLVNTLLDFAQTEAGRMRAVYEETDLAALTRDLASAFRSAIERAGLRYVVDCPPLPEPLFVDRDMWEKIVLNLVSNALKFTLSGEIKLTLRLEEGAAVLAVDDTGSGIPEHELPRMFERFHRIEDTKARTHEGSGIGLALVRDLVKLHHGDIEVRSKLGAGTTFTVTLPRGSTHLPPDQLGGSRALTSRQTTSFVAEAMRWVPGETPAEPAPDTPLQRDTPEPRAHILVADDNADMREYIARLLRDHWRVTTVSDGAAALAALETESFQLVVSDVMMPHVDGFELLKGMRSSPRLASTPIILLSARAGDEAIADGLRAGADDYLVKPFAASTLLVRVEAQLAAARSREAVRRQIDADRQRLLSMFEVSPAALALLHGRDLVVELANPNVLEVWGKSPEIVGKTLIEAIPELEGQPFIGLLHGVLDTGVPCVGKATLARLDRHGTGELGDYYFDFVYAPLREPGGRITGVFVHAFEVTELVNERRAAERANRMKDEFLATMSHELRTPLNAILGWASLLRARDYDAPARAKALETIERNARSQARLIDDVLDVSRIVSGKLRLNLGRVDIANVIEAATDVVRPAADAKSIRLDVRVSDERLTVNGDADRLQQVVWNLLSNAVRFTPNGGTISIDARRSESALRIFVRDTGAGIPEEHLTHVFERFRQVDSSTTRLHGGLGLGLAIVRHLVELHGGTVTAESEGAGRGATFTIQLPIRTVVTKDDVVRGHFPAAEPTTDTRRIDLSSLHILVADDDEDSRDIVAGALAEAGASVTTADSVQSALDLLHERRADLVISDIGMPGEDGYSFIRRLRALPAKDGGRIPAIALTAYARPEDAAHALAAGFDRHLVKPVDPDRLTATVAELAASRNAS